MRSLKEESVRAVKRWPCAMSHYGVARRKCGSPEWCYKALLRERAILPKTSLSAGRYSVDPLGADADVQRALCG